MTRCRPTLGFGADEGRITYEELADAHDKGIWAYAWTNLRGSGELVMSFHPDEFPEIEIDSLKGQLNNWLGDILPPPEANADSLDTFHAPGSADSASGASREPSAPVVQTDYDLGESFVVYRLDASPFVSGDIPDRDLSELAESTNRWHHQLIADDKAIGYSRSLISGKGICQMFVSDLAGAIQEAIVWLNAFEEKHTEYTVDLPRVRLLIVPGFNVYAFWIQRTKGFENADRSGWESHVLAISVPISMDDKLPRERMLDTKQFLSAFHGVTPMLGLTTPGANGNSIIQL